ncbi:MAG TPA: MerR family transcriptional regulator [Pyrinomonadaceae bacterium]|jgi:DNA-binding transcriptional MerR regulator|nr:MerR family transcriptional regulator [Pyrinomonadaceae bacterium]
MNRTSGSLYQASEFAERCGVTVRALHHYDRLGLLKPSGYTAGGYRLYGERDFARLQQIMTLKFIGLPLKQIKGILERNESGLIETLRLQRKFIEEQRRRLDMALAAIERAESVLASGDEPDWEAFKKIIEVIDMENNMEWVKSYYTEEQLAELSSRWSPELQEKAERDWAALLKDVEAAIGEGEDPSSERSQALAARWSDLIEQFTGGNPAIAENLGKLYADQANWPSTFKKPYGDAAGAFIAKAMASRKKA